MVTLPSQGRGKVQFRLGGEIRVHSKLELETQSMPPSPFQQKPAFFLRGWASNELSSDFLGFLNSSPHSTYDPHSSFSRLPLSSIHLFYIWLSPFIVYLNHLKSPSPTIHLLYAKCMDSFWRHPESHLPSLSTPHLTHIKYDLSHLIANSLHVSSQKSTQFTHSLKDKIYTSQLLFFNLVLWNVLPRYGIRTA